MAEVFESVIKIETGQSEQSVKGLKKHISDLRDHILNLEQGTEEYNSAVADLMDSQRRLDEVMSLTKKTATALDGSYDALCHQMALLRKEWKATNDEARRNELGKQIDEINDQLKELDGSIGNFQRNVGNYKSALEGLDDTIGGPDGGGGLAASCKSFQQQMSEMNESIEPTKQKFESVSNIASGVAGGFAAVQGAMALCGIESENFEKTMIKLQAAMALAQGIGGMKGLVEGIGKAKVAFQGLMSTVKAASKAMGATGWGLVITVAVTALTALVSWIKKTSDEAERLKQKQDEARESQEKWAASMSKSASGILSKYMELSEQWKSLGDDIAERNNFIKQNQDAFTELGIKIQSIADADKLFIDQTDDFVAAVMKRATAQSYSDRLQDTTDEIIKLTTTAKGNMFNTVVSNGGYTKGNNPFGYFQFTQGDVEKAFATEESLRQFYNDYLQYSKEVNGQQAPYGNKGKNTWLGTAGNLAEYEMGDEKWNSLDQAVALKANVEKILKLYSDARGDAQAIAKIQSELTSMFSNLGGGSTNDDKPTDTKTPEQLLAEVQQALYDSAVNMVIEDIELDLDDVQKTVGYQYKDGDAQKRANWWSSLIDNETSNAVRRSKLDGGTPEEQDALLIKGEERKLAKLKEFWEQAKKEGDVTGELALRQEIADQELLIEEEKLRAIEDAEERSKEKRLKIMEEVSQGLAAAGSVVQGITEIYQASAEKDGEISKQEAKRIKGLQIASATINMLQGAVTAFSSAQSLGPIAGPIVGGVNAAAVIAMGMANIQKIKNTDLTGNSSVSMGGASVTPNIGSYSSELPVNYTRNVTSSSEIDELNKSQKVVLVESEMVDALKKVEIRNSESSF